MSSIYTEQFSLFVEIVETQVMRDRLTDDGSYIQPPPGHGWRVTDFGRERHTVWTRRRPVVRFWKGRRK
jgi:hypothetical protein